MRYSEPASVGHWTFYQSKMKKSDAYHGPTREERIALATLSAEYVGLAMSLQPTCDPSRFARANHLSLHLAAVLPAAIYKALGRAVAAPDVASNPRTVALLLRGWVSDLTPLSEDGELGQGDIMWHAPPSDAARK